jgi:hypothetical protein
MGKTYPIRSRPQGRLQFDQPQDDVAIALAGTAQIAGYRRARLSASAGGAAFGVNFGAVAGSSFASAERSGSRLGARGNLSVSMARRTAGVRHG